MLLGPRASGQSDCRLLAIDLLAHYHWDIWALFVRFAAQLLDRPAGRASD